MWSKSEQQKIFSRLNVLPLFTSIKFHLKKRILISYILLHDWKSAEWVTLQSHCWFSYSKQFKYISLWLLVLKCHYSWYLWPVAGKQSFGLLHRNISTFAKVKCLNPFIDRSMKRTEKIRKCEYCFCFLMKAGSFIRINWFSLLVKIMSLLSSCQRGTKNYIRTRPKNVNIVLSDNIILRIENHVIY